MISPCGHPMETTLPLPLNVKYGKHKAPHIKRKCLHACVRLRALSTHHSVEKTVDAHTGAGLKLTVKRAVFHASVASGRVVTTTAAAAAAAHDGGACDFGGVVSVERRRCLAGTAPTAVCAAHSSNHSASWGFRFNWRCLRADVAPAFNWAAARPGVRVTWGPAGGRLFKPPPPAGQQGLTWTTDGRTDGRSRGLRRLPPTTTSTQSQAGGRATTRRSWNGRRTEGSRRGPAVTASQTSREPMVRLHP